MLFLQVKLSQIFFFTWNDTVTRNQIPNTIPTPCWLHSVCKTRTRTHFQSMRQIEKQEFGQGKNAEGQSVNKWAVYMVWAVILLICYKCTGLLLTLWEARIFTVCSYESSSPHKHHCQSGVNNHWWWRGRNADPGTGARKGTCHSGLCKVWNPHPTAFALLTSLGFSLLSYPDLQRLAHKQCLLSLVGLEVLFWKSEILLYNGEWSCSQSLSQASCFLPSTTAPSISRAISFGIGNYNSTFVCQVISHLCDSMDMHRAFNTQTNFLQNQTEALFYEAAVVK